MKLSIFLFLLPYVFGYNHADVVETLVNSGRQIEAVKFAHAFGLTEKFPHVSLLKNIYRMLRKLLMHVLKVGITLLLHRYNYLMLYKMSCCIMIMLSSYRWLYKRIILLIFSFYDVE